MQADPRPLFVYYEPDCEAWCIAHDGADATALYVATGAALPDGGFMHWQRMAPEKILKGEGSKTCAALVAEHGRTYLGESN